MAVLSTATRLDKRLDSWMRAYACKNYWKVAHIYELEDLMQDGYLVYVQCREHYRTSPHVVERRHFMALFKTAFRNHVIDLSNKCRKVDAEHDTARDRRGLGNMLTISSIEPDENREQWRDSVFGCTFQDTEFRLMLEKAKGPVKDLVKLFTTEAGAATLRSKPQRPRESLNAYVCRLIGIDHRLADVPELFASFMRGTGVYYLRRGNGTN
jgi:hypothetical protein